MYNSEKTASRQNKWVSLLICWLIILGGYLLTRMVFLIFGLQLHLAAQGACLVVNEEGLFLLQFGVRSKPSFFVAQKPEYLLAMRRRKGVFKHETHDSR